MYDEIKNVIIKIKNKDNTQKNQAIAIKKLNPIIRKYAFKHSKRFGLDINDYISVGNLGLLKAIEKYKPSEDPTFHNFFILIKRFIKNYMFDYTIRNRSCVRYIRTQQQKNDFRINKISDLEVIPFHYITESDESNYINDNDIRLTPEDKYINNETIVECQNIFNNLDLSIKYKNILKSWFETDNIVTTANQIGVTRQYVSLIIQNVKNKILKTITTL